MGEAYSRSFEAWVAETKPEDLRTSYAANRLALFLLHAALYVEAEPLLRRALKIDERSYGSEHPQVATRLNNLASLLHDATATPKPNRLCRALEINERSYGPGSPGRHLPQQPGPAPKGHQPPHRSRTALAQGPGDRRT